MQEGKKRKGNYIYAYPHVVIGISPTKLGGYNVALVTTTQVLGEASFHGSKSFMVDKRSLNPDICLPDLTRHPMTHLTSSHHWPPNVIWCPNLEAEEFHPHTSSWKGSAEVGWPPFKMGQEASCTRSRN